MHASPVNPHHARRWLILFVIAIAQLMVVDCLLTAVAQASFDESMAAVRTTYEAVHSRSLKGS